MYEKLKPVFVDILLDLDMYEEEYGSLIEKEPSVDRVRPLVVTQRTQVLRDVLGPKLFSGMHYERPCIGRKLSLPDVNEHVSYIREYLTGDEEVTEDQKPNNFYYMKLKESTDNPNLYFLEIILKSGFNTYMELEPSERMKIFLQDILHLLYENDLWDKEIVGYYMSLSLKGTESFKTNFKSFLSGEI